MNERFCLYDLSAFPVVRIAGSKLPPGYTAQWIAEMNELMRMGRPFAFVFLDSNENPTPADQKAQAKWLKANKKPLAAICRGAVSVEPDTAKRLLKKAQALAITAAFGLRFAVVASQPEAERLAALFIEDAGERKR